MSEYADPKRITLSILGVPNAPKYTEAVALEDRALVDCIIANAICVNCEPHTWTAIGKLEYDRPSRVSVTVGNGVYNISLSGYQNRLSQRRNMRLLTWFDRILDIEYMTFMHDVDSRTNEQLGMEIRVAAAAHNLYNIDAVAAALSSASSSSPSMQANGHTLNAGSTITSPLQFSNNANNNSDGDGMMMSNGKKRRGLWALFGF
jgi:hypothetical protein